MRGHISIWVLGISILWVIIASVQAELRHLIESPKATDWGTWGEIDSCPPGTFATGMQLKVEDGKGHKDDTGLNGIKFFCSRLGEDVNSEEQVTEVITSSVGNWGTWNQEFRCGDDGKMNQKMSAVVGFQLKSEKSRGMLDDTSANNLRIICADFSIQSDIISSVIEGDGTHWGTWTDSQFCKRGYAVCGMVTQVDHGIATGSYDDTSLNNVKAECCEVLFPSDDDIQPTTDPERPDPLESARNLQRDIERSKSRPKIASQNFTKPETVPEKAILSFSPDFVQEISERGSQQLPPGSGEPEVKLSTDRNSTNPSPLDHAIASHEISRIADLDFETPYIVVTVKVPINNEIDSSTQGPHLNSVTGQPGVPPEVIKFLKSQEENDEDPEPSHLHVIAGRIHHYVASDDNDESTKASALSNHEAQVHEMPAPVGSSSSICLSVPFLTFLLLFIGPIWFAMLF